MGFKNQIKDSFDRVKVKLKHPSLLAAKGLEGVIGFTTPIASVLTMGAEPSNSVPEKILYGPFQVGKTLYESVSAYAANTGVRDFVNGTMGDLLRVVGNTAENIYEHPLETAGIVAGTYLIGKTTKYAIKTIRKTKEEKYLNKN